MDAVLQVDYHIHTHYSDCTRRPGGDEMSVEHIVPAAASAGLRSIGLSDHLYKFTDPGIIGKLRRELHQWQHALERSRRTTGAYSVFESLLNVNILVGCEADVVSPEEVSIDEALAESLDFVLISFTHFQIPYVEIPLSLDPNDVAAHYLRMFERAVETRFATAVAHPFCTYQNILGNVPVILSKISDAQLVALLEQAKENHIAMELTPKAFSPYMGDCMLRFYALCKRVGVKLIFGSDAHRLSTLGINRRVWDKVAELDLAPEDFVVLPTTARYEPAPA